MLMYLKSIRVNELDSEIPTYIHYVKFAYIFLNSFEMSAAAMVKSDLAYVNCK